MVGIHLPGVAGSRLGGGIAQRGVVGRLRAIDRAAEILVGHRDSAVDEVAERIREIGVVFEQKALIGDGAVLRKRHLGQQIIPHGVDTEAGGQLVGIQHVALRLAHLVLAGQKPRVTEHLTGQRLAERHEQDRPVDRVEPHDVLADHMQVGGPVAAVQLAAAVGMVAKPGDIVRERVDPDIDHMLRIKFHRDAPFEGGAGHTQVAQSRLQKVVDHLVAAGLGAEEIGVVVIILPQAVLIFGQPQEIRLLLGVDDIAPAVGAFAVDKLRGGEKRFAGDAVFAVIFSLVDIALVIQLFEDGGDRRHMIRVGRADKAVIGDVERIPHLLDGGGDLVHILLRRDAALGGILLDLLPVLVRAGEEMHVKALHPLIAGDRVRQHDIVGVADMRLAGGIGDGGRDIKFRFHKGVILLTLFPAFRGSAL